ncbi:MAG TPA: hypothetical protein VFY84_17670 [Jiangellales bacterium]|nr:hypothetical protein [Jiangellales bacterium]
MAEVEAVADAVMYEGYLLYPYRRSSGKNRVRWQFGVLVPPEWAGAHGLVDTSVAGSAESSWQQTECLLEAAETATVHVRLRFLQLQRTSTKVSFDEAVPHEFDIHVQIAELLSGARQVEIAVPGGEDVELLPGERTGRVVRRREPISASVTVSAAACTAPFPVMRLRVRTENTDRTTRVDCSREQALPRCLLAAHTVLSVDRGRFISLLDPPQWAAGAAEQCRNVHTFPVLAGEPGRSDVVLSSPIIMYDHPQIAPESPGDLYDATEIDEILSLRTLTLSDEEKREVRSTDSRAAAILDRVEAMPPEVLEGLHGAVRSLGPVRRPGSRHAEAEPASWQPGADAETRRGEGVVVVAGVPLSKGMRVRLRPRRRGTDAHDMFLEGRTARVEEILLDVDGSRFLAVTVDDDPGADLHQWYGRLRHFRPDEVEPMIGTEVQAS